jgi:hypothetical protein
MKSADRMTSRAAGMAAALLALGMSGCHKHTDSLVVVTAVPPAGGPISGLDAVTVLVGTTSQTFTLSPPLMTDPVNLGLYVPETAIGPQTVYVTATHQTGPCAPGYAGSQSTDIQMAGDKVAVRVDMTVQSVCPPGSGGAGGSGGGGAGGTGGSGGGGAGGTGGSTGRGGTGGSGGTGGGGGTTPHVGPDFSACIEIDQGDPGTCGSCTSNSSTDVQVYGVAFSPTDPTLVVTGSSDGRVKIWKNTNGTLMGQQSLPTGTGPATVAFSPNGATLAVGRTGAIDLVDASSWTVARTISTSSGIRTTGVAFSPDGANVIGVGAPPGSTTGGALFVYSATDPQAYTVHAVPKAVALGVSPAAVGGGLPIAVTDGNGKASIFTWSTTAQTLTGPVSLSATIDGSIAQAAAFAPGGSVFAAGGNDGLLSLWNYPTTNNAMPDGLVNLFSWTSSNTLRALAFTPTYGWVVVGGGAPGTLSAYYLGDGSKVGRQFDTRSDVISLAISPNANVIAAGEAGCGCIAVCRQ